MTAYVVDEAMQPTAVLRILVVEDSPSDALMVRSLLQDASLDTEVTEVQTFAAAMVALTDGSSFDCVLLDLGLPDADGMEALTGLVGRDVHAAIVVLTGRNDERSGLVAVAAGAQDYLIKGEVTAPALARSLKFAVQRNRARQTSARLAAIIGASPNAVLRHQIDGTIETWNAGAERLFGYTATEAVGRDASLLAPTDPDAVAMVIAQAAAGAYGSLETRAHTRSGSLIDIAITASPIRMPDQRVTAVSTIIRDISERRIGEEQLRFQAELLDSVGQAVIATDITGTISYWNKAAERIYGWTAEEARGRLISDVVVDDGTAEQAASRWG